MIDRDQSLKGPRHERRKRKTSNQSLTYPGPPRSKATKPSRARRFSPLSGNFESHGSPSHERLRHKNKNVTRNNK